jgi:hypothetical protein
MKILICFLGLRGYPRWGFEEGTKVAFRIIVNIAVLFDLEIIIVAKISWTFINNMFLALVLLVN